MRRIDELHLDYPFAGSRMLQTFLARMGIEAIYRQPNTSKPAPGHTIFPYLLRKLPVTRPNQVWAMDITYIPMARGFVYLAAVVDWFSRKVLAWKLSITLETEFCLEAVEEALARYGKPEIFNTDQGSQFTSIAFTGLLLKLIFYSCGRAARGKSLILFGWRGDFRESVVPLSRCFYLTLKT